MWDLGLFCDSSGGMGCGEVAGGEGGGWRLEDLPAAMRRVVPDWWFDLERPCLVRDLGRAR
ncbi:hypothetical protein GCM10023088_26450 [Actinomadura verrucosospora]